MFGFAEARLGAWPDAGDDLVRALGATQLVVPPSWLREHRAAIDELGYQVRDEVAGHAILDAHPRPMPVAGGATLEVPSSAGAGKWMTLAREIPGPSQVSRQVHSRVPARWVREDATATPWLTEAFLFHPGVTGVGEPERLNVPTPNTIGLYRLEIATEPEPITATIPVRGLQTTDDSPIADGTLELDDTRAAVTRAREGAAFAIYVHVRAGTGPVLLATSTQDLPERRGETILAWEFHDGARGGEPALADLVRAGAAI